MSSIDPEGLAQKCSYEFAGGAGLEHPQIFFQDKQGGDLGFYPQGDSPLWTDGKFDQSGRSFEALKKAGKCENEINDDSVMRQAFAEIQQQQNMRYNLIPIFGNKCKTMMMLVLDRYNYLMHQKKEKT